MAAKATTVPAYEPETDYDLEVAKPVTVNFFKYLPRHQIVAKGSLINDIVKEYGEDAIRSANPRG
jgi:hypothetical protein